MDLGLLVRTEKNRTVKDIILDRMATAQKIDPYLVQIEDKGEHFDIFFSSRTKINFAFNLCQPPSPEWDVETPSIGE